MILPDKWFVESPWNRKRKLEYCRLRSLQALPVFPQAAIDGQVQGGGGVDKFRIKIWDKATDEIIYDNQVGASDNEDPTTALGGGSIVIHKE